MKKQNDTKLAAVKKRIQRYAIDHKRASLGLVMKSRVPIPPHAKASA